MGDLTVSVRICLPCAISYIVKQMSKVVCENRYWTPHAMRSSYALSASNATLKKSSSLRESPFISGIIPFPSFLQALSDP